MNKTRFFCALWLMFFASLACAAPSAPVLQADSGDIAWMLVATVLVFMMSIPGVALFYSGLVRMKNAIGLQVQVLVGFALALLVWIAIGYALAFSDLLDWSSIQQKILLMGISIDALVPGAESGRGLPTYIYVLFQGAFAAITCVLVLGGMAERLRFSGALVFTLVWLLLAYVPIAHMVWHRSGGGGDGLMASWGVLDFAGGLVVHVNAGVASLLAAYMIDHRTGFGRSPLAPHSLNNVLTGTAFLWLGWAGFNAGSALGANALAGLALMNTMVASCAGCLAWVLVDKARYGKATALGAASGSIAGLIGVTPAAGFVAPWAALVIGVASTLVSFFAISLVKRKWRIDDALDVFAIHGVSGLVGSVLVGIFAFQPLGGTVALPEDMNLLQAIPHQLGVQALGVLVVLGVSSLATFVALMVAEVTTNVRLNPQEEGAGLDEVDHAETAYNFLNE